jgi:hypothetical protein
METPRRGELDNEGEKTLVARQLGHAIVFTMSEFEKKSNNRLGHGEGV